MALRSIRIADVKVPERRARPLGDTAALAESIRALGLLQPIVVTEDLVLVSGLHRLVTCQGIGWDLIPAQVMALSDVDRELAEIDENLIRNELSALERGEHLMRRQELYEARHPETKHGGAREGAGRPSAESKRNDFALNPVPAPRATDDDLPDAADDGYFTAAPAPTPGPAPRTALPHARRARMGRTEMVFFPCSAMQWICALSDVMPAAVPMAAK